MLEVGHLVKRFGGLRAVDDVSFTLREGTITGLIGPNGAGKTTLFDTIAGVHRPTAGQIRFRGRPVAGLAPHRIFHRGLVRTFQINQLFASLTPLQSLALAVASRAGAAWRCWQPVGRDAAIAAESERLVERLHLAEHAERPTRELPYGKRRLLEIGLALALEPRVLLLDEPAAGVPATERQDILDTVAALPADVSVLLIEHDMDLVFSFARRITVLVNGAVLTEGTPEAIAADPRVRAVYLGEAAGAAHG